MGDFVAPDVKPSTVKNICRTPRETFDFGEKLGERLRGGEIILLTGSLGAGKTLLTKAIVSALGFDPDEVTSPSFALVNQYPARIDVYHIDLWRIGGETDPAFSVGLDEILANERAVTIVEWAEHLNDYNFPRKVKRIDISGDGDDPRVIQIREDK